jgi:alkylation response protein AidB-like acyl-CoA dehydrogenase
MWIINCGIASWYFVLAQTSPSDSPGRRFSGFVVDRNSNGVVVGKKEKNLGQRCADVRSLRLEDVRVPKENVVGQIGQGFAQTMQAFDRTRPLISAMGCGIQQRALDEATRYAVQRKTFGRPIIEHEGVGFKLADMAQALEASKLLTKKAAEQIDLQYPDATYYSSIAKCFSADSAFKSSAEAVQVCNFYCPIISLCRSSVPTDTIQSTQWRNYYVMQRHSKSSVERVKCKGSLLLDNLLKSIPSESLPKINYFSLLSLWNVFCALCTHDFRSMAVVY